MFMVKKNLESPRHVIDQVNIILPEGEACSLVYGLDF